MNYKIEDIEGIGPAYAKKLATAKISTTRALLKLCCDKKGRKKASKDCDISEKLLLTWVNLADLMRISGIGPQFSELLEAAGVDTVKELRNRNAENLAEKMREVNAVKRLTRATPPLASVEKWIATARTLEPLVTH